MSLPVPHHQMVVVESEILADLADVCWHRIFSVLSARIIRLYERQTKRNRINIDDAVLVEV